MNTVVLVSPDRVGRNMAGPGIRYYNLAKELSRYFQVILLAPEPFEQLDSIITIRPLNRANLKSACKTAGSIIVQGTTLWQFKEIKTFGIPIVVDLYDPFILENLELRKLTPLGAHRVDLAILTDQLAAGDFFICSSERQVDLWIGALLSINRINPLEYAADPTMAHLIQVVPFGMPNTPPAHTRNVMKGVVDNIAVSDIVILWGGGVWRWLDPISAIHAVQLLKEDVPNVRLYFLGTGHPTPELANVSMAREVRALSDSLGLTDRFVFFNDWVAYEDRQNYLIESDVGLSLHLEHLETRYSYRTRMLDYFWASLPIVCSSGDVMSQIVADQDIGSVVPVRDVPAIRDALLKEIRRGKTGRPFGFAKQFEWHNTIRGLVDFCKDPHESIGKTEVLKCGGIPRHRILIDMGKFVEELQRGNLRSALGKAYSRVSRRLR